VPKGLLRLLAPTACGQDHRPCASLTTLLAPTAARVQVGRLDASGPAPRPCVNCSAYVAQRWRIDKPHRVGTNWMQGALYHLNAKRLQARILDYSAALAWTTG